MAGREKGTEPAEGKVEKESPEAKQVGGENRAWGRHGVSNDLKGGRRKEGTRMGGQGEGGEGESLPGGWKKKKAIGRPPGAKPKCSVSSRRKLGKEGGS